MPEISDPILRQYAKLTEFLALTLGPDYEVVLHDLRTPEHSVVAIANNHISGREVGAPLNSVSANVLRDKSCENADYRLHYYGVTTNGREVRSSTFFIEDQGKRIGMLCINFDDSRYRAVSNQILRLCHPDMFVAHALAEVPPAQPLPPESAPENYPTPPDAAAIARELDRLGVTPDRLTAEERLEIIAALDAAGVFQMKGAVKTAAGALHCSQASVYRYLSQIRDTENGTV